MTPPSAALEPARLAEPIQALAAGLVPRAGPSHRLRAWAWKLAAQSRARPTRHRLRVIAPSPWRWLALSDGWQMAWAPGPAAPIHWQRLRFPSPPQQGHVPPAPIEDGRMSAHAGRRAKPPAQIQGRPNQRIPRQAAPDWS